MAGHFGGRRHGARGEHLGSAPVQLAPLDREEILENDLGEKRVLQRVSLSSREQQLAPQQLLERVSDLARRHPGHLRELFLGRRSMQHGARCRDVLRRGGELRQATSEERRNRMWKEGRGVGCDGGRKLRGEEGIALAASEDLFRRDGIRARAEEQGDLPARRLGTEWQKHLVANLWTGRRLAQPVSQKRRRFVCPHGGDDAQRVLAGGGPREVVEEIERRGVAPVQVVEDQHRIGELRE